MLFCAIFVNAQYTLTIDDVEFDASTGTITEFTNTTEKDIIIPAEFDGVAVTTIGRLSFDRNSLETLIIPNSVTNIANGAFTGNQINSLTISSSITSIPNNAFSGNNLSSVTIPSSVTNIESYAFMYNPLEYIGLPIDVIGYENEVWKNNSGVTVTEITEFTVGYTIEGDRIDYSVSFIDWDGTVLKIDSVPSGSFATAPDAPEREDYTFTGWDMAFDVIRQDITITAQYESATSINYTKPSLLKLYPNPANTQFTIEGVKGKTVNIYNIAGVLLKQVLVTKAKQVIDVSEFAKGIYVVQVGSFSEKLMIK